MADIVEYLYRDTAQMRDNSIDWGLQDDLVTSGTYADTTLVPTRIGLELTDLSSASTVTIDTITSTYTLGVPGDGSNTFQWLSASSTLVFNPSDILLATIPAGSYSAKLWFYNATYDHGLRWGRERVVVVVE